MIFYIFLLDYTCDRRRKKLLDDLKDRRGYCQLKEEALDRTMWRNHFGRGFGPDDDANRLSSACAEGFIYTSQERICQYCGLPRIFIRI